MLEKLGYAVTLAVDGKETLQSVHLHAQSGHAFDLVLMDVQMPEMDGLEAVRAIRKWEAGKSRMPVIALTAHAMDSHRVECLAAGMDGYIAKPFRLSQLVAEIARLCPVPDLVAHGPVGRWTWLKMVRNIVIVIAALVKRLSALPPHGNIPIKILHPKR